MFVLFSTISYSQRNFTMCAQYDTDTNNMVNDFDCKFSYWINNKGKFILELEGEQYSYSIQSEIKGATVSGFKYTSYNLKPDDSFDKEKQVQVFDDKSYGIRLFITNSDSYYQFFD
jgi:hypothetical protein